MMAQVFLGLPQGTPTADEIRLLWWNIPVGVRHRRFWEADAIEHCRAELVIDPEGIANRTVRLLWSGISGPQAQTTLRVGEDDQPVSIVVRGEADAMVSGDPVHRPHFPLPQYVARISDENALIHRTQFTDLVPGIHRLTLRVLSGATEVAARSYRLHVPGPGEDNSGFVLEAS